MKKENKEKFEKMLNEAFKKYFDDVHKYRIYEVLQKAQNYRKELNITK